MNTNKFWSLSQNYLIDISMAKSHFSMYAFAPGLGVSIIGKFIFDKIHRHWRRFILELCRGIDIQLNAAGNKNRNCSVWTDPACCLARFDRLHAIWRDLAGLSPQNTKFKPMARSSLLCRWNCVWLSRIFGLGIANRSIISQRNCCWTITPYNNNYERYHHQRTSLPSLLAG